MTNCARRHGAGRKPAPDGIDAPRPVASRRVLRVVGAALLSAGLATTSPALEQHKVVFSFDRQPVSPYGGVIEGSDGALYGTASEGGSGGYGVVYKVSRDGTALSKLVDFTGSATGSLPYSSVIEGSDGALYGTTLHGGSADLGVAYKVNKDGTGFAKLVDFLGSATGSLPYAGVIEGSDGALYGTTFSGGSADLGVVYKVNKDGTGFIKLVDLTGSATGKWAYAGVIEGSDGALYGTTYGGGSASLGVVYKVNKDGTGFTKLVNFTGRATGGWPYAGVIEGSDGALYGTTYEGGPAGLGVLYKVNKDGTGFTKLVDFTGSATGSTPRAGVIEGSDGALYGTTHRGGATGPTGFGVAYRVKKDGTGFTKLIDFTGKDTGTWPLGGVIEGSDGALYGTTYTGGSAHLGVVYRASKDGTGFAKLVDFTSSATGGSPRAGVIEGSDGALYGTTYTGGAVDKGVVYRVNKNGTGFTKLVNFTGSTTGSFPEAGVIEGSDGALYGTTAWGGSADRGAVYKVNKDGTGFRKLVDFTGGVMGWYPHAGVIEGSDGALYGTTFWGGPSSQGVVYKVSKDGTGFTTLAGFMGSATGDLPYAGVIEGSDGTLYGTTSSGNVAELGVVYKVDKDGTGFTKLVDFTGSATGSEPYAGVIEGSDGALYGTTRRGGSSNVGVVYKVDKDGTGFTKLADFAWGSATGSRPMAGVIEGPDGALYGTTNEGGSAGLGVLYKVDKDGTGFTKLVDFTGSATGSAPWAGVIEGSDGALYGTAYAGGSGNVGVVYRYGHPPDVGTDFDGDGHADVFWRKETSGENAIWLMNGRAIAARDVLATLPPPWVVAGAGDLDGDGKADVAWRNPATGENAAWLMNGTRIAGTAMLPRITERWDIAGVGDFDGDGKEDLLWRHGRTGHNAIWFMNGTTVASAAPVSPLPGPWAASVGDLDRDGKADILWFETSTGQTAAWLMDGASVVGGEMLPAMAAGWTVGDLADLDGDARADVLWRDDSGQNAVWFMNGLSVTGGATLPTVPEPWALAGAGDFDGDGKADVLWRNTATGENAMWRMNRGAIASAGPIPAIPDPGWSAALP